ncbi:hypothetical protein G5B37_03625 [Rasiella rasia]|uniref:Uncharacterized protein n=1 Tax=Rasiella rasia TaxID=2744027 RepID=A0A6G6GJF3_9FLAO|nr:hypothetical protein [Rasiella rasia]QIE58682.1 hypothetical protein G5B37_03625 [Rasiella rasia]
MIKEFILKKSPLLKIVLRETEFEIINQQYKKEGGMFEYSKLYNIEFREESIDHSGSLMIFIMSLFLPKATRTAKFRERLIMNYDKKQKKVILFDFDKQETQDALKEIRKLMDKKYLQSQLR